MPKGIGYGEGAKKRASKRNAKKMNEQSGKAKSKQFGKAVQVKSKSGGTIGYNTTVKTKLPPKRKVKTGTGSPQHKKSVKASRKRK